MDSELQMTWMHEQQGYPRVLTSVQRDHFGSRHVRLVHTSTSLFAQLQTGICFSGEHVEPHGSVTGFETADAMETR